MKRRSDSSPEYKFEFAGAGKSVEIVLTESGLQPICGVDEAGRGPLAGPVVAAALIFRDTEALWQARDSKVLTRQSREDHYQRITESLEFAVGTCTTEEIDSLNILRASLLAMQRAISALPVSPKVILVDGVYCPRAEGDVRAIPHGDARVATISAASIVAKVHRDRLLLEYDEMFPDYGFARHKGYPTAEHRAALRRFGPCPIHRKTFKGVREFFQPSVSER